MGDAELFNEKVIKTQYHILSIRSDSTIHVVSWKHFFLEELEEVFYVSLYLMSKL